MADHDDIVGYVYQETYYCPEHIMPVVYEANPGWELAEGIKMSVEDDLREIAWANSIRYGVEEDYHSDDFPKPLYYGEWLPVLMVRMIHCHTCGKELIEL